MKKILAKGIAVLALAGAGACTNLDPEFYSKAVPELYPKTADEFNSFMGQPYDYLGTMLGANYWISQECTADCFVVLIRNMKHFNDGWSEVHEWDWHKNRYQITERFGVALNGIAWTLSIKEEIEKIDYTAISLDPDLKQQHLAEMDALLAFYYMKGLDGHGGMPIYEYITGAGDLSRSTDRQTFDHIETLLKGAIPSLPVRGENGTSYSLDRTIHRGAAAAMLAQLYFQAQTWTGEDMYDDCAEICQELIDGEYGEYGIEDNWQAVHGFDNKDSREMMWCIPSADGYWEYNWWMAYFYHGAMIPVFEQGSGSMNAICMQPSRNPAGNIYADSDFKLGRPYEKFHPMDVRKKSYKYDTSASFDDTYDGTYEGMFSVGTQYRYGTTEAILCTDEYIGQPLVLVDQVARFSQAGNGDYPSNPAQLPSTVWEGEENSGFRLVKTPIPNGSTGNPLRFGAAQPIIRFTEVHYMLAECKFRAGDKAGCASIINDIRKRNFPGGEFPAGAEVDNGALLSAEVPATLDEYRLLDEWLVEFLGEGRRRTDIIRFGMWTTEEWWAHEKNNDANYKKFPIGEGQLNGNSKLEQNPGYNY